MKTKDKSNINPGVMQVGNLATAPSVNQQRRRLMKAFAASGLAVSTANAAWLASASELAVTDSMAAGDTSDKLSAPATKAPLSINIISSSAVPGDSVVLRNGTSETLMIRRFVPGNIVFGNRLLDLNLLVAGGRLEIAPSAIVSFAAQAKPLDGDQAVDDYVWSDESTMRISDDAVLVSLGAIFSADEAIVFVNPQQPLAQDVQTLSTLA